jgi:hypothetical protein
VKVPDAAHDPSREQRAGLTLIPFERLLGDAGVARAQLLSLGID